MAVNQLDDRAMCNDMLMSQKHLLDSYNLACIECSSDQLLKDFAAIWQDELNLQRQIFAAINSRGWYAMQPADNQDVSLLQQQLRGMQQYQQGMQA